MVCQVSGFDLSGLSPDSPVWKKYLEFGGYAAEAYQSAFNKFQGLLNAGLVEPGKERDAAAKSFAEMYQEMSERANRWLSDLPANGPLAEAFKDRVAQEYISQAQQLSNEAISAEARLNQLTADVNARLQSVSGPGDLAGKIGTAFDGVQLVDAFVRGDTADFYGNLAQMLGAEVGGILAASAVALGVAAVFAQAYNALKASVYATAQALLHISPRVSPSNDGGHSWCRVATAPQARQASGFGCRSLRAAKSRPRGRGRSHNRL